MAELKVIDNMKITNFSKKEVKVKSFVRKGKLVKAYKKNIDQKNKLNIVSKLSIGVAGTLGLAATSYAILKGKYRNGIKDSVIWAKNAAKQINVPDLTENELKRNNINFAVGGLRYEEGLKKSTTLASYIKSKFKGHTVAVDTTSFNTLSAVAPKNNTQILYELHKTRLKESILKGYNPTSRELAATMYAYHKKYPTHTMVSFGHSYGGAITDETMTILSKMDVDLTKFKNVSYGATYNGLLDTAPNSLNIIDVNDWQTKLNHFPNSKIIGIKKNKIGKKFSDKYLEDHGSYHYLSIPEVIEKTKQFIAAPKDWKPPIKIVERTASKKQISTNTADTVTQEIKLRKEVRKKLNKARQEYNQVLNNSNIPEDKKQQVLVSALKKVTAAQEEHAAKTQLVRDKLNRIRKQRNEN